MSTSGHQSTGSSLRTGSTSAKSSIQPSEGEQRKSSLTKIVEKAKTKMSGSERLPNDERDFERQRQKEVEKQERKQERKQEYERLGLGDRTKFGVPGAGRWNA